MAVWYEAEKTEDGIRNFMECNWDFHDFHVERVTFFPLKRLLEVFLSYEPPEQSVVLRFTGVKDYHFQNHSCNDCDIMAAKTLLLDDGGLLWYSPNDLGEPEAMKADSDWVEADRILWAVTNAQGIPDEMPAEKFDQVWIIWGKREEKHFRLKEFEGDADALVNQMKSPAACRIGADEKSG